jgi:phosphatidylglycerophosphatase A
MNAAALVSTVFGIGRAPAAPGTVASIAALPIAWLIQFFAGPIALAGAALAVFALGIWFSAIYARETGVTDPSEVVIDEVAGQWLACALSPLTWTGYLLAFALFRLFDIAKIWPVSWGEQQRGGLGIMLDDLIAGAIAGVIVWLFANAGLI